MSKQWGVYNIKFKRSALYCAVDDMYLIDLPLLRGDAFLGLLLKDLLPLLHIFF